MTDKKNLDQNSPDHGTAYGTMFPSFGPGTGSESNDRPPQSNLAEHEPSMAPSADTATKVFGTMVPPSVDQKRLNVVTSTHAAGSSQIGQIFQTLRVQRANQPEALPADATQMLDVEPPHFLEDTHKPPTPVPNATQRDQNIGRRPGRSTWNLRIRERGIAGHVSGVLNQIPADPSTATGLQSALTVDDSVPEYEVIDQLGAGSMGIVYRARQTSLNRELAIKTLNPDAPNVQHDQAMFVSEAVVTANLVHPNIVPIHDLGRTAEGKLFYSMKQVTGTAWSNTIQSMSLEENLDILLKVCDAVAYAHSRGVINRDLKPENVIVGNYGEVVVLDWGLAITTDKFPKKDSVIVDFRGGGGTPVYMAPELADSDVRGIGEHSDIYLLGAILFEILEGSPPHLLAETRTMTDPEDILNSVVRAVLENRIETQVQNDGELMQIARKAMESYPQNRHGSVEEFQEAIREYRITGRAEELMHKVDLKQTTSYAEYQTAVALYEEALRKWPNNRRALEGDRNARLAYAELAHQKGDVDLGLQIIPEDERRFESIRSKLQRTRRMRSIIRGTWSLLFVAAIGLSGYLFYQKLELDAAGVTVANLEERAEAAQEKADTALKEAEQATLLAAEEKRNAAIATKDAAEAKRDAAEAGERAEIAKKEARDADEKAKVANAEATEAKMEANVAKAEAEKAKTLALEERVKAETAQKEAAQAIAEAHRAEYATFDAQIKAFEKVRNFQGIVDAVDGLLKKAESNPVIREKQQQLQKIRKANASRVQGNAMLRFAARPDEALLSQDGKTLLLRSADTVYINRNYSPEQDLDLKDLETFNLPDIGLIQFSVADEGAAICAVGYDGVLVWQWNGSAYVAVSLPETAAGSKGLSGFQSCLFSHDARHLYLIGSDKKVTVRIYELNKATADLLLDQQVFGDTAVDMRGARDAVLMTDNSGIVLAVGDGGCRFVPLAWNDGRPDMPKRNGREIDRIFPKLTGLDNLIGPGNRFQPDQLFLSPDGTLLAVAQRERLLILRRRETGSADEFPFLAPDRAAAAAWQIVRCNLDEGISDARFSSDNTRLAVAQSELLQLWDLADGRYRISDAPGLYEGHSLAGHAQRILSVGFVGQSSNRLLSHSYDKRVWVWDTERYAAYVEDVHQLVKALQDQKPERQARRAIERPSWIMTGAQEKLADEKPKALRFQQARRVYSAEFSGDSERIIVGANDLAAHAFDSRSGTRTLSAAMDPKDLFFNPASNNFLEGHLPEIVSIQFLPPKGELLLTSDYFGSISVWDSRNDDDGIGYEKSRLLPEDSSCEIGVSRDGQWLVSGGVTNDGAEDIAASKDEFKVVIWKTADISQSVTPAAWRELKGEHDFRVTAAAFSPDGKRVITAGRRGRFVLWDFINNQVIARAENGHGADGVTGVFFCSETEFISAGFDGRVFRWRQENGKLIPTEVAGKTDGERPDFIVRLRPNANGSRFVTSDLTRDLKSDSYVLTLNVWSSDEGWKQQLPIRIRATEFDKDKPWRHDVSWSEDGSEVLYVHDGTIMVLDSTTWKVKSGYSVTGMSATSKSAVRGVFAPDNGSERRIATFDGRFARMWNLDTGEHMAVFRSHGPVVRAGFSADRMFVATASDSIRLFYADEASPEHGRTVFRLPLDVSGPNVVSDIRFSPKNEDYRFASVDVTGAVKLWNWAPNTPPPEKTMLEAPGPSEPLSREMRGERVGVTSSLRWTSDARYLAAVQRGRLKIWTVLDGRLQDVQLQMPEENQYLFHCLDFSASGEFLTAGGVAYDPVDRELRSVALVWQIKDNVARPVAVVDARDRHSAADETRDQLRGITAIAIDPVQNEIITGGADSRVLRWQMVDPDPDSETLASLTYLVEKEGLAARDGFTDPHRVAITSLDAAITGSLVSADEAGFIVVWPAVE